MAACAPTKLLASTTITSSAPPRWPGMGGPKVLGDRVASLGGSTTPGEAQSAGHGVGSGEAGAATPLSIRVATTSG
eukprot:5185114-Alexandrium_andersonii.AAC.1